MDERTPIRIWVISDLHVETSDFSVPRDVECDAIVIAGDVADGADRVFAWLRENIVPLGLPVVYVPGNHDHYGMDLHVEEEMIARGEAIGVNVLYSGQALVIGDVRFVGAVLWTDYAVADDVLAAHAWARTEMPDMRAIDVGLRRVYTKDLAAEHQRHLDGIVAELEKQHPGPTVVVTHHAPHPRSLQDHYASHPSDASFASDLTWVMERYEPDFWLHGHTHSARYFEVAETQVLCNPRGYVAHHEGMAPHAENDRFDPRLVIDV